MMWFTTKLGAAPKMAIAAALGLAALGLAALGQPGAAAAQGLSASPSAVTLQATMESVQYGDEQAESLIATVTSTAVTSPAGGTPTGTVTVSSGSTALCTTTLSGDAVGSCTLTASQLPSGTFQLTAAYSGDANYAASASAPTTIIVLPPAFGFVPVPDGPMRILDTRDGLGGHSGPVGAGQAIGLQVTGSNGIPASGVTAVVLNVTAVNPTANSYVTVYPDGEARPVASNLDFAKGRTVPNLVTVPVGADGKVNLYNNTGTVNLIADLAGYYIMNAGSWFVPDGPARILDTRNGTGGWNTPVGAGKSIALHVVGQNGVPTGVTAVVLNVTAVNPTAASYVTVFSANQARPPSSNLDFTAGQTAANLVTAPVGSDGMVALYNNSGTVNLTADLAGYYIGGAGPTSGVGSSFVAAGPARVLDTRNGTGGTSSPVGAGKTISLQVTGQNGVPGSGVTAVVLNVTAVAPAAASYVTVYPDGQGRPVASNLDLANGQTVANLVVVPVGADGKVDLYNNNGTVNLIADLAGYYIMN